MSTINRPGEEPTPAEIKAWWNWATKFRKKIDSPFDIDWGSSPGDRTNRHQNDQVYHLAGTAGDGGSADTTARTLQGAKNSGKKILVPVFVACGEPLSEARTLVGTNSNNAKLEFLVDDKEGAYFYNEMDLGELNWQPGNSFEETGEIKYISPRHEWSAGFWSKLNPNEIKRDLVFGGNGGKKINSDNTFVTRVKYS
jgi:hypothetical protein